MLHDPPTRDAMHSRLSRCLEAEFRAMQRFMAPPSDFYEGIRAALVDKDRNPKWSPAVPDQVSGERIPMDHPLPS